MAKTKNHSIRFDESDWEFICKRQGFKTAQQVVNFLIFEYMKLYKVEKPSIFIQEQPKIYDSPKIENNYFSDEPKQWAEPNKKELSNFESWKKEISGCDESYELEKLVSLMEKDKDLLWNEKNELKRFCLQIGKQKGFQ